MRYLAWAVVGMLVTATARGDEAAASLEKLAWMTGHWVGESDGVLTEEVWLAPRGGMMLGMHRDAKGSRAFFEFLRIEIADGKPTYLASPKGRPPVAFGLKRDEGRRAVFENVEHDFPKRIIYWLDDEDRLHSRIEGDDPGKAREWTWSRKAR